MDCLLLRGVVLIITFWPCLLYLFWWFLMLSVLSFRIHVYNNEDLILCSLPYHDTHPFVRIVQILDTRLERYDYVFLVCLWCELLLWLLMWTTSLASDVSLNFCKRNTKWGFLDGVKASGAPPPRMVIVQQCIRDKGILDALCNYVSNFCVLSCEYGSGLLESNN